MTSNKMYRAEIKYTFKKQKKLLTKPSESAIMIKLFEVSSESVPRNVVGA